ncbi:unnamed protein product [Closterium sp. Yama58-4]|nr:unnamed protein product [Closterium sp. Yama58-4]
MGVEEDAVATTLQGVSTQDGGNKGNQALGGAIPGNELYSGVVQGMRSADVVRLPAGGSGAADNRSADATAEVRLMNHPSSQAVENVPGSGDFGAELPHDHHNHGRDVGFRVEWEKETEERSWSPSDHRRRRRSKKDEIIELLFKVGREVRDGRAELGEKLANMQRSIEEVKTSTATSLQQLSQTLSGVVVNERLSSSEANAVKAATTHLDRTTNAAPIFTEKQFADLVAAVTKAAADALESAARQGMWTLDVPTALHRSVDAPVHRPITLGVPPTDDAGLPLNPGHAIVDATLKPNPNLANQGAANTGIVLPGPETEDAGIFQGVYTVPVTQGDVTDMSRKGGDVNFVQPVPNSCAVEQCNTLPVAAGEGMGTLSKSFGMPVNSSAGADLQVPLGHRPTSNVPAPNTTGQKQLSWVKRQKMTEATVITEDGKTLDAEGPFKGTGLFDLPAPKGGSRTWTLDQNRRRPQVVSGNVRQPGRTAFLCGRLLVCLFSGLQLAEVQDTT